MMVVGATWLIAIGEAYLGSITMLSTLLSNCQQVLIDVKVYMLFSIFLQIGMACVRN